MQAFSIHGGRRLVGTVDVTGSKNSTLSLLSAVLLSKGPIVLRNAPDIVDVRSKAKLLESLGARIQWIDTDLHIDCSKIDSSSVDIELAQSIRTSFFLLGPLLARLGKAYLPSPGGCRIGARPVDYHLKGLAALGATIDQENGFYVAKTKGLRGASVYLDKPSPGATQHLMVAAVLAKGITTIQNAAMEPEVVTLADFLNAMGARVNGAGTSMIEIEGVSELSGTTFRAAPDRIQAGTYMMAAAITGGDVTVRGLMPDAQAPIVSKLLEAGAEVTVGFDEIRVQATQRLKSVKIRTMPYPGFPTDLQQPMCALMSIAEGTSIVEETVYESRIGHVRELVRMGANIHQTQLTSIITGVDHLEGADVEASDLRAGAALVLAGLAAEGNTIIRSIHHIDRGYERLEQTLSSLGASIVRETVSEIGTSRSQAAV
jgi:UDP-N-acetylglucosamine 1-carboxyvinyltransferase